MLNFLTLIELKLDNLIYLKIHYEGKSRFNKCNFSRLKYLNLRRNHYEYKIYGNDDNSSLITLPELNEFSFDDNYYYINLDFKSLTKLKILKFLKEI